ncbi:MAG: ATP synthase F0 subunit B [Candidatus Levybacteria bacterium CG10_big_fil_rev_8_21_14_0_10_35_13]|nr:MAG: ATP synthase F0 subunit B [Candidatus Levybacteria bacterium CG10_big_fil_rev_8_21_14_0_10_35_13]
MEFLENLGFDPIMLGAQILNFLIIFYLLKRFLYKPVLDMVKKREDKITQGLKDAEDAQKALDKALGEEKKILSKASENAKKIIEDAKEEALILAKDIGDNSKTQTEKLLEEAKAKITLESLETEKRLSEKISTLAADMVSQSLKGLLSEKEKEEITKKTLKGIKHSN